MVLVVDLGLLFGFGVVDGTAMGFIGLISVYGGEGAVFISDGVVRLEHGAGTVRLFLVFRVVICA